MAKTFADLGVSEPIVDALGERGITEAFPIQAAAIEATLEGRDICGKAPTGSGKTLAFGIPAVELCDKGTPWRPSVLILSPTRELASQIKAELEPLAKACDRSILTVYGGTNIQTDINRLEKGVDILVACPGRLEDLMSRRCCELRDAGIVVVDEADRMADMGFLPSVKRILDQTPNDRHMLLFSATLDGDVDTLIKRYQSDPLTYEIEEPVGELGEVEHSWYLIQPVNRIDSAVQILQRYYSSIVFCRTRRGCDRVAKTFKKKGLPAVAIHGDRSQSQRERALADFTKGKAQVLVATDVAARGIHVDNVALVMHYDPAGSDKDYIHRSGRTGRAGQDGRVISMVVEDKKKIARQLQKDLGMKPGFDDLDMESFDPVIDRPAYVEPDDQPRQKQDRQKQDRGGDRDRRDGRGGQNRNRSKSSGNRNDRDDRGGRDGRGKSGNNRNRNSRDDRDDRDGRNDRGGRDSRGKSGNRNSRDDRGRGGNNRNRNSRDDRGGRGDSRNDRNRNDRGGRDSRRKSRNDRNGQNRRPRRRRGANDWYPPGYDDDRNNQRPSRDDREDSRGRGGGSRPRGKTGTRDARGGRSDNRGGTQNRSGQKRGGKGGNRKRYDRDEEVVEEGPGGSGSTKRKDRSTKGRHADKGVNKNKGKRRNPRKK